MEKLNGTMTTKHCMPQPAKFGDYVVVRLENGELIPVPTADEKDLYVVQILSDAKYFGGYYTYRTDSGEMQVRRDLLICLTDLAIGSGVKVAIAKNYFLCTL